MCDICLRNPCHPRCPNAADPPAVFICSGCGDNILDGDEFLELCGEQWCMNCVDSARRTAVYDPY